jgi:hypothetical protein
MDFCILAGIFEEAILQTVLAPPFVGTSMGYIEPSLVGKDLIRATKDLFWETTLSFVFFHFPMLSFLFTYSAVKREDT